ncbi:MAG: serpin family protein [Eubacteriales bacterium]
MKKAIAGLLCVILLFSSASCGNNAIPSAKAIAPVTAPVYPKSIAFDDFNSAFDVRKMNALNDGFTASLKQFSYAASSHILSDADSNANYSPLSLYLALALAATGAEGSTKDEMLNVLGVKDAASLSAQCSKLYRLLYTDNKISKLKIANSVWMDNYVNGNKIAFKDSYKENASENFYASLFSVDFADKKTGEAMGQWITDNTNGTLAPALESSADQIMTIINSVYFYDEWVDRFDKNATAADTFHLSTGDDVTCDFMNMKYGTHSFSVGDGFLRSGLALKNGGEMVFILPDEGVSIDTLLASPEKVQQIFESGDYYNGEVVFQVPKFKFGSSFDMIDTLKSLGIQSAFAAGADFSGITDGNAFISGVRQDTHIAIDEIGVEASAFTKIDFYGAAAPDGHADMILDRPFIYGITAADGTLLFAGVCINPAVPVV